MIASRPFVITTLAALIALLAIAPRVFADERYTPDPGSGALHFLDPDGTPSGRCPLEHTDVEVEISGFVARVVVTQRFRNPSADPVEAIYTFPMSHRGAVDAMWMRTDGREVRGEIQRREDARRIYEAARAQGRVAGLLDQERPNIFTQHVANLMPGAEVEIEIQYVETLDYEAGAFEFSFPTVVGPRFVPGRAVGDTGGGFAPDTDRVPDGSRITPPVTPEGTRAGHDIDIHVDVDAGVAIRSIESPLHEIEVTHEPSHPRRAQVRLARRDEIPNRDFVLRYRVARQDLSSGALVHRLPGKEGHLALVLLPPERVTRQSAAPKELVFVIDRSGSQSGLPLAKAKETLLWILENMNPNDTFQVIDFGSTANQLFDRPRLASAPMKARARRYIEALNANGGTMMAEAIRAVAATPADGNRLRIVTFMTDGYVGNDFEVIDLVRQVRGTSRWFPFGTGNNVNRFLLDGMAREGGGEVEYVLLDQPGDEIAKRFWQRIASPVLTDVRIEFHGLDVDEIHPAAPSDVWAERPLIFHARYRGSGRGRVELHGYRGGEPWREVLELDLPRVARDHDALASIWARAKVDDLMHRDLKALQSGAFPDGLREEIVAVALEHRLVTQFTSFVAVEDRVVNHGGQQRTEIVRVEMPQGVSYEGVFGLGEAESGRGRRAMGPGSSGRPMQTLRAPGYTASSDEGVLSAPHSPRPHRAVSPAEPKTESDGAWPDALSPTLRALLEHGVAAAPGVRVRDGRVWVEVRRADGATTATESLEQAGLEIRQRTDRTWTGWIDLADLAALARVPGVERIDAA